MNLFYTACYLLASLPIFRKGITMLRLPPEERSVPAAVGVLAIATLAVIFLSVMTFTDLLF